MIDIYALTDAIKVELATDSTFNTAIGNKVVYGIIPESVGTTQIARPYASLYIVADEANGAFGGNFLDSVNMQITVFSDSFKQACELVQSAGDALNGSILYLSSGKSLGCVRQPGLLARTEQGRTPVSFVYSALMTIKCYVQS